MPLFQRKFVVPKFPTRKSTSLTNLSQLDASVRSFEFGLDYDSNVRTRLSGRNLVFRDGQWIIDDTDVDAKNVSGSREGSRLGKETQQLTEENNLLKLKIDILLDMLAETTAEVHLQENEIDNLRCILKKKAVSITSPMYAVEEQQHRPHVGTVR